MLAVHEDGLMAEVRDGGRLTFIPKSVIVDVPFVDNGAISIRTESRPIQRPAIEQVKVDRTTTSISTIVRFSHEATAVQLLQTLLAVGKYIEKPCSWALRKTVQFSTSSGVSAFHTASLTSISTNPAFRKSKAL